MFPLFPLLRCLRYLLFNPIPRSNHTQSNQIKDGGIPPAHTFDVRSRHGGIRCSHFQVPRFPFVRRTCTTCSYQTSIVPNRARSWTAPRHDQTRQFPALDVGCSMFDVRCSTFPLPPLPPLPSVQPHSALKSYPIKPNQGRGIRRENWNLVFGDSLELARLHFVPTRSRRSRRRRRRAWDLELFPNFPIPRLVAPACLAEVSRRRKPWRRRIRVPPSAFLKYAR